MGTVLVSAIFDVSFVGALEELWGCEADDAVDDTEDLEDEKK